MSKIPKILFYVGDVTLFLIGVFHLVGHFTSSPTGSNENQKKFLELFSTTLFEMPSGEMRTYQDIYNAFSLYFGVLTIGMALLIWISARHPNTFKPALLVGLIITLATAFITFKFAILPPLVMMLIVAVCFLGALIFAKNEKI